MGKRAILVLAGFGVLLSAAYFSSTIASQDISASIKEIEPFAYCCLEHEGIFSDMPEVIGRLMENMREQNIAPQGGIIAVYRNSPDQVEPEALSWEVGFPVMEQAFVQLPLLKKTWEYTSVAETMHIGPYEKTGETIVKLTEWLGSKGYETSGPILETYFDMNPDEIDPAKLRTQIWIPVKKK
jgi:effector-binding domain-containing protein